MVRGSSLEGVRSDEKRLKCVREGWLEVLECWLDLVRSDEKRL